MKLLFLEIDTERSWAVASIGPACLAAFVEQAARTVQPANTPTCMKGSVNAVADAVRKTSWRSSSLSPLMVLRITSFFWMTLLQSFHRGSVSFARCTRSDFGFHFRYTLDRTPSHGTVRVLAAKGGRDRRSGRHSQWHTLHAAVQDDDGWKLITTPAGQSVTAELTQGLMAKIEPRPIATGGYLGPRLRSQWLADGDRVWLLWERKSDHRGSTPRISGDLIGRPCHDGNMKD